jgi:hypothetical protein
MSSPFNIEWMIFFMTGKYFMCNLLDLMTYLLKHEHHEWFVMKNLEKIKVYFKLKKCGIQNVLKLFWIRLLHFYLCYPIQCFSCLIIYINFVLNNIPKLQPFWSVCFEGLNNWAKSFMSSIENLFQFFFVLIHINFLKQYILGKNGCNFTL